MTESRAATRDFLLILLAYVLLHLAVRLAIPPVLTIDDAREAVLGQTLAWGYQPRQPPLYNWLVWAAFQVAGVRVLSLALVKYALLAAAYGLVYASARRILRAPRLAVYATCALVLVVPVSWTFHEALTHSAAVLAACALTFYLLLRLEASGSLAAYAGLGAAVGLGALSKYTYALFAAALLLAALTLAPFRRRLRHPAILLSLGVAALLILPFAHWLARHGYDLGRLYADEVRIERGDSYPGEVLAGLAYIVRIAAYYLTPTWLVLLALFPGAYRRRPADPGDADAPGRLVERFLGCALGLLVAAALASALAYLKFRWMIPAFFLAPLYGFWRAERGGYEPRRLRALAAVLVGAEVLIVGAILGSTWAGSLGGRPSRFDEPYDRLAEQIAVAGFRQGTIVVGRGPLAGSLRLRFPDSRVISLEHPYYLPGHPGRGQCLVAWEKGGVAAMPSALREFLAARLDARLTGDEAGRVAEAPYHFAPGFTRRVGFVLLDEGRGRCR